MKKKRYQKPLLEIHCIQLTAILAGSGTGATGEDALWKAKKSDTTDWLDEDNN